MEEQKKFIIRILKYIILFICLVIFFKIAEDVFTKEIMIADYIGYDIISNIISYKITPIAKIITNLGGAVILIFISIISIIFIKNRKIGFSISINLIIITMLNLLLKNILQRERPTEYRLINETGYSFPSGHSMISMAFYGFIIYLIYKNVKNKYIKWISIFLLSLLILFIGISRIYLGVHYTTDVIGGFCISISYLIIYVNILHKIKFI